MRNVTYHPRRTAGRAGLAGTVLASAALIFAAGCNNLDNYGASDTLLAPSNLAAAPASSSAIQVTWHRPDGATGKLTYQLFRNGASVGTTEDLSYSDAGLTANTSYTYAAMAVDDKGNTSPLSTSASATTLGEGETDTDAPSVPTNLTAVAGSSSTIQLAWTASTDAVGVLGYHIFRGGVHIADVIGTQYTDTGLQASTAYTYTVTAYDGANNTSTPSDPATTTTLANGQSDTEAPSVPAGLVASATLPNSIGLTWNASTDNVGVVGYVIYRNGVQIGTSVTPSYTDNGLCAVTLYSYTVAAYDAANNQSAESAPATATTVNVAIDLGAASDFALLAGVGLNVPGLVASVINGDVGLSPGTSIVGLQSLLNLVGGVLHNGDATAASAQVDLGTAFNGLLAQPVCGGHNLGGSSLGGLTLTAGTYNLASDANLSGTLTLNAQGNANATFVIKVNGDLSVANGAQVVLTGGAQAQNVYWVVDGSASVGTLAHLRGNLLTTSSINLGLSAQVDGRVLSRNGTVSLLVNVIGL